MCTEVLFTVVPRSSGTVQGVHFYVLLFLTLRATRSSDLPCLFSSLKLSCLLDFGDMHRHRTVCFAAPTFCFQVKYGVRHGATRPQWPKRDIEKGGIYYIPPSTVAPVTPNTQARKTYIRVVIPEQRGRMNDDVFNENLLFCGCCPGSSRLGGRSAQGQGDVSQVPPPRAGPARACLHQGNPGSRRVSPSIVCLSVVVEQRILASIIQ